MTPTVGIVVTTHNHATFLAEALRSCVDQTKPPSQIVVIDDASDDSPEELVSAFANVTILKRHYKSLSRARNRGLHEIVADLVIFLDADDRLQKGAVQAAVDCFARNPRAALCYGAYRLIDAAGVPISAIVVKPLGDDPRDGLIRRGNMIGMHAAVAYRRDWLIRLGGFDVDLPRCEDYDLYLRAAAVAPLAQHDAFVAEYRRHGGNMSNDHLAMYRTMRYVLERHAGVHRDLRSACSEGRRSLKRSYARLIASVALLRLAHGEAVIRSIALLLQAICLAPWALTQTAITSKILPHKRPSYRATRSFFREA